MGLNSGGYDARKGKTSTTHTELSALMSASDFTVVTHISPADIFTVVPDRNWVADVYGRQQVWGGSVDCWVQNKPHERLHVC